VKEEQPNAGLAGIRLQVRKAAKGGTRAKPERKERHNKDVELK